VSTSEDCSCAADTSAAAVGANLAKADATTILEVRTIIVKSSVMAHHLFAVELQFAVRISSLCRR
jgi:hypothetical protein